MDSVASLWDQMSSHQDPPRSFNVQESASWRDPQIYLRAAATLGKGAAYGLLYEAWDEHLPPNDFDRGFILNGIKQGVHIIAPDSSPMHVRLPIIPLPLYTAPFTH